MLLLAPCRALDTGLDPIALRGLRLSTPNACPAAAAFAPTGSCPLGQGATATEGGAAAAAAAAAAAEAPRLLSGCPPAPPANLTVLVGSRVEELLGGRAGSASVCVAGVAALPGQAVEIDCGRLMHGACTLGLLQHASSPCIHGPVSTISYL